MQFSWVDDPAGREQKFLGADVPADSKLRSPVADDLIVSDREVDKLDANTSGADNKYN